MDWIENNAEETGKNNFNDAALRFLPHFGVCDDNHVHFKVYKRKFQHMAQTKLKYVGLVRPRSVIVGAKSAVTYCLAWPVPRPSAPPLVRGNIRGPVAQNTSRRSSAERAQGARRANIPS